MISHLCKRDSEPLSTGEGFQLIKVPIEYADSFVKEKEDLARFSLLKHRIITIDEAPVQERMQRPPKYLLVLQAAVI